MFIKAWIFTVLLLSVNSLPFKLSETIEEQIHEGEGSSYPRPPLAVTNGEQGYSMDPFLNIWKNRLEAEGETPTIRDDSRTPKTILVVSYSTLSNLIPQDAGHPLYSPTFRQLTDEFLLDSLSTDTIDLNNPQLTTPEGVTIKSISGKDLVFKKDPTTDKITVNGIEVEDHRLLTDNTNIITLTNYLFTHYDDVQTAFQELSKGPQKYGPLGTPLEQPHPIEVASVPIPAIPEVLKVPSSEVDYSQFLKIWEYRLTLPKEETPAVTRSDETAPKTVLAVNSFKTTNLVPQDAPNPLYDPNYVKLTNEFILDSLSTQTTDLNDPQLVTPEGITIKSISGKDLLFKKDPNTDKISVNGIEVENNQLLTDNTNVFILSNFLFTHYDDFQEAFKELSRNSQKLGPTAQRPEPHSEITGVIPKIPEALKTTDSEVDASRLVNIWANRLSKTDHVLSIETKNEGTTPKTVLAVNFFKMINLVPQDAPNPLYSPEYEQLTDEFILDSLSTETVDLTDLQLKTPEGITIKTISGKDLVFKKDPTTYKITVNGIDVENHKLLTDNTNVIIISDFLFTHKDDVRNAFRELSRNARDYGSSQLNPDTPTHTTLVPNVPESLKAADLTVDPSNFVNLWENRITNLKKSGSFETRSDESRPTTILAVNSLKMTNLVPQDAPNPLYATGYEQLTDGFIFDSLSTGKIDFNDQQLTTPEGLTLKTLSEKDLVFKKDQTTDKFTVNGITIENHQLLPDNTIIIIIDDFLFDNYDKVQTAFKELTQQKTPLISQPIISPLSYAPKPHAEITGVVIPNIPEALKVTDPDADASRFVRIWENRLSKPDQEFPVSIRSEQAVPKIVFTVPFFKMVNLIPQDAPNPLFAAGYEKLANEFIFDSLSTETIDFNDPRLLTAEGVTIKTLSGKDLVIKKEAQTDLFTVNGIEVETYKQLSDNTIIFIVKDFLFTLYDDVQKSFRELSRSSPILGPEELHNEPQFEVDSPIVPRIPESVKVPNTEVDASQFVNLWEHRLSKRVQDTKYGAGSDETTPKTIVAVNSLKMTNLSPQDAPNPLYAPGYEQLADGFLADSLSVDTFDFNDPRLTTPEGLILKSFSGKDLVFKKDENTNEFAVNAIPVESFKTLEDGTNIFIITDFLFTHQTDVQNAFKELTSSVKN